MMNAPTFDSSKIALFDMDETLVDFQGPLRMRLLEMKGPEEEIPENLWAMPDHWYARAQAIKKEPGFWRNLPRLQWGWDVLEIAIEVGFDIHILTKGPTTGSVAWSEKVDWVRENLPDAKLHITDDKRIAYGRVFVDDYWPFMELWLRNRPRGLGIVNYSSERHENLTSIHDGMDTVRQRLQEAYER
jgi:5'(3')-deoxyribonucleotidase